MPRPLRSLRTSLLALAILPALVTGARAHEPTAVPIADLTRRIAAHPDSLPLYLERAELRRIIGDFRGARDDQAQVERLDPHHPQLDVCRAALALDTGDPAAASRWLDAALLAHPDDAGALTLRARARAALGERAGAIADLGAAIGLMAHPSPDLFLERARLQVAASDDAGARAGLDQARARIGAATSLELFAIDLDLADGRPADARARFDALAAHYADRSVLAGLAARIAAAGGKAAPGPAPAGTETLVTARHEGPVAPGGVSLIPPTLMRGPYLQMGNDQAVTVRWRTSVASDSRVTYGASHSLLTSELSNAALTTEHEVRITGLASATRYWYAVGTTTDLIAGDSSYTFRTAPAGAAASSTRVWVIGDSGASGATAFAVRDAYAAWTGARGTDVWLMLGDNAYSTGTDSEYQHAVFDQYPLMLRQCVLWPTRGNHDVLHIGDNNDYYDIFTMPTADEAGGLPSGTEAYYAFNWANIHFVCLDSEGSDRSPGGAMLTWLANDLAANRRPWVIAYWHHPPYSKGSHDSDTETALVEMRENAVPILEAGGVDLVLCGHSHAYERSFLLDGHYGRSTTLTPAMIKNGGDGRPDGDGAYLKPELAPWPHAGAVYTVAGCAASVAGGALNHPVMVTSLNVPGSVVLDIHTNRLEARFLSQTGAVMDSFAIDKAGVVGVADPHLGSLQLGPALPNPFRRDLSMGYVLERAGRVRLAVYDPSGRRVATLEDGWREAGAHEARWAGRDDQGREVTTGIYLAVLEAGGRRVSRKIAHVR